MNDRGGALGCRRLGLGTVQFGIDYGITNTAGKVSPQNVHSMLEFAAARGIDLLDTAALYGDSEAAIGATDRGAEFSVVTKTPKFSDASTATAAVAEMIGSFERSLLRLRVERLYGLILHSADDLIGPHGQMLWDALCELRQDGRVKKIGVSVYDGHEIDAVLDRYDLDLVQLPFNAIDRRLEFGGQLKALRARGAEIHCRSIFLQGVLLQDPDQLPSAIAGLAPTIRSMRASFQRAGLTVLEGLLASVLANDTIDRIIVGTTSPHELEQIADAADRVGAGNHDLRPLQLGIDERLLNPAKWNAL